MISRIDHVAVAVRDYRKAAGFFQDVLGAVPGASGDTPGANFFWCNHALGDLTRLELLTPTQEGGLLDGFLKHREGGVHHVTLQTPDMGKAKKTLEEKGIPYFGANEYPGGVW
ncbi:MAG: VOC family protein, partial [Pseudomonadota bacterium]